MRTGRPKQPLILTEQERDRLQSLAHRARSQALLERRARVVRACAEGLLAAGGLQQLVADKGYHSNEVLEDLAALQIRTYISEPDRGRRRWRNKAAAQVAVYGNRRRIRGERGKRLLRQRGERVERSFAHLYETGGMRQTHLRGHPNILKRLLIPVGAFNLSLVLRKKLGAGTPRGLAALKKALQRAADSSCPEIASRLVPRHSATQFPSPPER